MTFTSQDQTSPMCYPLFLATKTGRLTSRKSFLLQTLHLHDGVKTDVAPCDAMTWFEWSIQHWGTESNACSPEVESRTEESATIFLYRVGFA